MTGMELLLALDHADPAYVQQAGEPVRRPWRKRALLLAACLCLTMAAAAFAAGPGRIWLKEVFSGRRLAPDYMESGFLLGTEPERVPLSQLSRRVRSAGEIIAGQYRDYSPLSSKAPGRYSPEFTAQQEVLDYVGYAPLRGVELDAREEGSTLILWGDEAGTILSVTMRTWWKAGQDVRGETRAQLYTEKYDGETDIGSITTEKIHFQTEEKTSASGRTYVEVSSDPLASGYETLEGHLLDGSVIYSIHLAFRGEERDTAQQLLEQWAEQF